MSQSSISSFFNTRKRILQVDDAASFKNKLLNELQNEDSNSSTSSTSSTTSTSSVLPSSKEVYKERPSKEEPCTVSAPGVRTRSSSTVQRTGNKRNAVPSTTIQALIAGHASPKKLTKKDQQQQQETTEVTEVGPQQTKLVQFIKKGTLSPKKKVVSRQEANEMTPTNHGEVRAKNEQQLVGQEGGKETTVVVNSNVERVLRTPTKQIIKDSKIDLKCQVRKELKFDEVKSKITRSAKLQELKASLERIKSLEETRKAQEARNKALKEGATLKKNDKNVQEVHLKQFDTIDVEVLTSPRKSMKTPTKSIPATPDKNELMSPRHTNVSKRVLFSPSKDGGLSPSKMVVPPAYQRFLSLAESSKAGQLPLPFKYRHILDIFKGLDCVCAMLHNRKECITFKKLKTAVQRMLRKNFTETHLAQIKHIFPQAFTFCQMKMRNYGSASKTDYFQLVITPNLQMNLEESSQSEEKRNNVEEQEQEKRKTPVNPLESIIDEDDVMMSAQRRIMNPQIMTKRLQYFQNQLLERVKEEHDRFLRDLQPPLIIAKNKVTRWHPDFDLEGCPSIELASLPQPPNVEKYSSAKDILSTARNLFNCGTPMEKAMARYEAKMLNKKATETKTEKESNLSVAEKTEDKEEKNRLNTAVKVNATTTTATTIAPPTSTTTTTKEQPKSTAPTSNLLKGIPQSLLEKIRARQAAKEMDAMTRRPSQDQEATKYARLPKLARHIRNVFITERKSVLTQEMLISKIQNSFGCWLSNQEIEQHLQLLTKAVPDWAALHEVRKTLYLKINKDMDMKQIVEQLEKLANEKSKM